MDKSMWEEKQILVFVFILPFLKLKQRERGRSERCRSEQSVSVKIRLRKGKLRHPFECDQRGKLNAFLWLGHYHKCAEK